jgi:hypothetical protein
MGWVAGSAFLVANREASMKGVERKVGLWQPPGGEAARLGVEAGDRPVIPELAPPPSKTTPKTKAAPRGVAPAAVGSIRLLPEHFAQPGLTGALRERRGRVLVAEGDSWFDFPVPTRVDLLDALDELGIRTVSLAYRGNTLENMVYGTQGEDGRVSGSDLDRLVRAVREADPPAVLFSAGGNDVAGEEFRAFLNHRSSGRPALREAFLKEFIHEYVRGAYTVAMKAVWAVAPGAKFVVHGYSHARPTGLGVGRLFGLNFVGPWLKPAFDATGYSFDEGSALVRRVIDEFNAMLAGLAAADPRVVHVDLRPHVGQKLEDWSDELHLVNAAVRRAAKVYRDAIRAAIG